MGDVAHQVLDKSVLFKTCHFFLITTEASIYYIRLTCQYLARANPRKRIRWSRTPYLNRIKFGAEPLFHEFLVPRMSRSIYKCKVFQLTPVNTNHVQLHYAASFSQTRSACIQYRRYICWIRSRSHKYMTEFSPWLTWSPWFAAEDQGIWGLSLGDF